MRAARRGRRPVPHGQIVIANRSLLSFSLLFTVTPPSAPDENPRAAGPCAARRPACPRCGRVRCGGEWCVPRRAARPLCSLTS